MTTLTPDEVLTGLVDFGLFGEKAPPCFTTKGLQTNLALDYIRQFSLDADGKLPAKYRDKSHDYIRYEALRDINVPRHMGVPHPESHVIQALAIMKSWAEIESHCNKPNPKISRVYVRKFDDGSIFEFSYNGVLTVDPSQIAMEGGSVFKMNYKGAERDQLEEDEINWATGSRYAVHADISACFSSIYSHSIPWALHGRDRTKIERTLNLAGNLLDHCTQLVRDKQTNGLLIGPHSSNIISEIVLSAIDVKLQEKGYKKLKRHIDDYVFYASSHEESEKFIKDLGLTLREYELTINEKKTLIIPLPNLAIEDWKRELKAFRFSVDNRGEVDFSTIRSFLDLAVSLARIAETSAPLGYAIKMIPDALNVRAKRLFVQEAINLALVYPYLTPYLEKNVFDRFEYDGISEKIEKFVELLIKLGTKKLYPDSIAYALFYALKYKLRISCIDQIYKEIIEIDDCLTNVLLLEFSNRRNLKVIRKAIQKKSADLKASRDLREHDKQWLLIYQTWSESELKGNGQDFLALLKSKKFSFLANLPEGTETEASRNMRTAVTKFVEGLRQLIHRASGKQK